jgi:hypothetical protein
MEEVVKVVVIHFYYTSYGHEGRGPNDTILVLKINYISIFHILLDSEKYIGSGRQYGFDWGYAD